jgi:hypothetical protein
VKHTANSPTRRPALARFFAKITTVGECWEYGRFRQKQPYQQFWDGERYQYAHRFAYSQLVGPIPAGMYICHGCDNPICVNPDHLYAGTASDNMHDKARRAGAATHCKRGHEFAPENTILEPRDYGGVARRCRTCLRERQRIRRARAA